MRFSQPLCEATLLRRHRRFLADVAVNMRDRRTIYCPNGTAMQGLAVLGSRIWFYEAPTDRRKNPYTWALVEVNEGHLVCVDLSYAHHTFHEAIQGGHLPEFQGYQVIKQHASLPWIGKVDFLLENAYERCIVHVCPVTLGDEIHRGFYPEAELQRHVEPLMQLERARHAGYRAVLLFVVLHTGIERVFPSDHIDLEYGKALRQAKQAGVECMAYRTEISLEHIALRDRIDLVIPAQLPRARA